MFQAWRLRKSLVRGHCGCGILKIGENFHIWLANNHIQYCWKYTKNFPVYLKNLIMTLSLFRMDRFVAADGRPKESLLYKICRTYLTIKKLGTVISYIHKMQKRYKLRDTPLEFCWSQHFFTGNQQLFYINKYWYRFHFNT